MGAALGVAVSRLSKVSKSGFQQINRFRGSGYRILESRLTQNVLDLRNQQIMRGVRRWNALFVNCIPKLLTEAK